MFRFPKREHIVSTKLIETLFGSGSKTMAAYPLRVVFRKVPRQQVDVPVQVLISVPKKRLRHAVDRNRVKRQIREAYRNCGHPLADAVQAQETLLLGFVWTSNELMASAIVYGRIEKLLKRVSEKI